MMLDNGFNNLVAFMGVVEDNDDPTGSGRVRVRCFGFHSDPSEQEILTDDLPWATLLNGTGGKFYSIPDNGDWVFGFFLDGRDAQHPLILGIINTAKFSLPWRAASRGRSGRSVGVSTTNPFSPSAASGVGSSENADYAMKYFMGKGLSPEQAAAVVGNLQQESGKDLNPSAVGDGGAAYGIAQWNKDGSPDRVANFERVTGTRLQDSTFEQQLDFVWYEMENPDQNGSWKSHERDAFYNAPDVESMAQIFDYTFEKSDRRATDRRIANAKSLYESTTPSAGQDPSFEDPQYVEGASGYLESSQDAINNFGNPPLPPQMSGEDLEVTPVVAQMASQRDISFNSPTHGERSVQGAAIPYSGSIKSSIWQTRYGGAFIELSGKEESEEFINISHSSGSFISIDHNGNVSIRSQGDLIMDSLGAVIENAGEESEKIGNYKKGYTINVENGNVELITNGSMVLSAGQDVTINAGGKLTMNVGDAIDIAGARIAATARVDTIDLVSATDTKILATAALHIKSTDAMNLQSSGGALSLKGSSLIAGDAGQIHWNSGKSSGAASALAAGAPDPIAKGVISGTPGISNPSPLSAGMMDDMA